MSEKIKQKSSYSKTGFSSSFSCCSRYTFCQLGKGDCYYAEIDPEVKESCRAWVRHHLSDSHVVCDKPKEIAVPFSDEDSKDIQKDQLQLSLFD